MNQAGIIKKCLLKAPHKNTQFFSKNPKFLNLNVAQINWIIDLY